MKNGKLFFDFTSIKGEDAIDGIKVDVDRAIFMFRRRRTSDLSPEGKHLGTIVTPQHAHNMAWGDATARHSTLCSNRPVSDQAQRRGSSTEG